MVEHRNRFDDSYVYLKVKLFLHGVRTKEEVRTVIEELDYTFDHEAIWDTEIVDIHDYQIEDEEK